MIRGARLGALALLSLGLVAAGCLDQPCDCLVYRVSAVATFDTPWEPHKARSALESDGFTVDRADSAGISANDTTRWAYASVWGTPWKIHFGLEAEEIVESNKEARRFAMSYAEKHEATYNSTIAAFEAATGWAHTGDLEWVPHQRPAG